MAYIEGCNGCGSDVENDGDKFCRRCYEDFEIQRAVKSATKAQSARIAELEAENADIRRRLDALVKYFEETTRSGCAECGSEPGCNIDCDLCLLTIPCESAIEAAKGGK
jgi:hypothetical protein